MACVQQELGGFGHVVLLLATIVVVVLVAWRTISLRRIRAA
jgi:hypothetical protein